MKQNLTSRVGRIVSGSLNALIDAVENAVPETVMEEAIREVDGVIQDVRVELGRVVANKHLANTRLREENKKHEDLTQKIELAVKQGRDDLAEAAISQQFDIEAQIPVLEATIGDSGPEEKELESYINALQAKKREMNEELKHFRNAQHEATVIAQSGHADIGNNPDLRMQKATSAFDRIVENATGSLGSATDLDMATKLAELETWSRNNRIKERLAAIKNKANSS